MSGRQITPQLSVRPISDEESSAWVTHEFDVDSASRLRFAVIGHENYGRLYFGTFTDGHIGWRWKENRGGGPVTIVYAMEPGKNFWDGLWVGLLIEDRKNMASHPVLCITGGFVDPKETHALAHRREFAEETGGEAVRDKELPGVPFNSNRNYFIADYEVGEGVHAFAVEVPWKDLITALDGTRQHAHWQPKNRNICFMPWYDMAVHTPDALAGLPILRLLASLYTASQASEASKRG